MSGRLLISIFIQLGGCAAMYFGAPPEIGWAVVGFGAGVMTWELAKILAEGPPR